MDEGAAPLIVTAELGADDLAMVDGLRRQHFPPERNVLQAHLTMFHALPPSAEGELKTLLSEIAAGPAPMALLEQPYSIGRGVALKVRSPDLATIREHIAYRFHGMLTAQDRQGWRPHITIQNKVTPDLARDTLRKVEAEFKPRPLQIAGIGLYRYLGGSWGLVRRFPFRG
ncbi:2'-5' RNA ligase family protein [Sphingomonas jaspsi]|uniref:2'-5' RNA ligase family protein n=1 Tax=Sphingomonas jaspsi TaxID=392409 RepID=UPI0004B847C5|nr:2'-5' RNA ligase family protein [Sphingomonas jaspsi]